jgi:hypothetical protein
MDEARERHLLSQVPTLRCKGQIEGFRKMLADQGETPTGPLQAALLSREKALS